MKDKFVKSIEYLFLFLLICQVGGLIFFNLSDIRCSLDHDAASAIYHYMEVIKNRTLRLPDWNHTTTLELDGSFMLAVPIFFMIKNIFLSIGIANIIMACLYLFVVYRILYHANIKKTYIYFVMSLVITPYSYGMLEYFNMLFYGASWYTVKTLVPLLFLLLVQLFNEKKAETKVEKVEIYAVCTIYAILLFVTVFSSGIYAFLCGILPMIICILIDIWTDGEKTQKYNKGHLCLFIGSVVIYIIGSIFHSSFYPGESRTGMALTKAENYPINFRACITGIFEVLGAFTSEDIEAMSKWGIIYCLKMGLVILLIIAFLYNIRLIFSKTDKLDIRKYLSFIFLFNFLLLLVADTRYSDNTHIEYRYYLIAVVPLILLLGIQLADWEKKWNFFQQQTVITGVLLALALVLAGNNKKIIDDWDRTTYAVELCDYFNTLDIDSVIFINDGDTAVICKGIDPNHKFGAFMSETQSFQWRICSYYESTSGSFYGDKNILAVIENNNLTDLIPEEIAAHYEKIGKVRWYDIYYSDKVYFP